MTFETAMDQRPATRNQIAKLNRLAEKFGMPPAKPGLTSLEATDALRGLEYLNRWQQANETGKKLPPPPPDPQMQPYRTLENWTLGRPAKP